MQLPSPFLNVALLAIAALLLAWRMPRLRGTTLLGPWFWAMIGLLVLVAAELWLWDDGRNEHAASVRFLAACGTFCPLISLLGAKRPQHTAWHFVVAALWAVLALPSLEAMFLHRGQSLEIHAMRGWFLWVLIGLEAVNLLPTRFWNSTLLFTASQVLLFANQLPWIEAPPNVPKETIGCLGVLLAILVASLNVPRRSALHPYDKLWLDFRDSFGALWAMRAAERINAAAQLNDWPIRLGWNGFQSSQNGNSLENLSKNLEPAIQQALVNLLRRFVSSEWISQRLHQSLDQ
jgi:hypothetical protein